MNRALFVQDLKDAGLTMFIRDLPDKSGREVVIVKDAPNENKELFTEIATMPFEEFVQKSNDESINKWFRDLIKKS